MPAYYPVEGRPMGLVYRECPCGEWCATCEGSYAPRCGVCGEAMLPFRENRRDNGLGFYATFGAEIPAFVRAAREHVRDPFAGPGKRHIDPEYLRAQIEAMELLPLPEEALPRADRD